MYIFRFSSFSHVVSVILKGSPDSWVITEHHCADAIFLGTVLSGDELFTSDDGAVIKHDSGGNAALARGMRMTSQCASPGDVAVACVIERVAAFGKGPASAGVEFAESKEVGGDVLLGTG